MAMYSYIIKGGTIIDGSGFPKTLADVGITGEMIKTVGSTGRGTATRVIDASNKYVVPGFVDITNHSDTHWALFNFPKQESMIAQGITTILGGVCGSSIAPLTDPRAIRSIQKWTDITEVNVNWRSSQEFYEELKRHELGVNFGTLVGHGTLRRDILGDESREAGREELEAMKLLLKRSLDEGALGISFALGSSHGKAAGQEEIIALSRIVAESKKLVSLHLKNEGRYLLQSVVEAANIARASGADIQISHFKGIGRRAWGQVPKALTFLKRVRKEENLSIWIDFFPYLRTGSLLYTLLPEWMLEGGKEKILTLLSEKRSYDQTLDALKSLTLHYENMVIAQARKDKHLIGKSLATVAQDQGIPPEEAFIQILLRNDLSVTIFNKTLKSTSLTKISQEPFALFASDGVGEGKTGADLTHPRSYGAAPRFLDRLVKRSGLLTWEAAIQKMTSLPALRMGLGSERGLIKKGYFADVVIFDPELLKDQATYQNPYQFPKGVEYVFINGRLAYEKGTFTGALAGHALRRQ